MPNREFASEVRCLAPPRSVAISHREASFADATAATARTRARDQRARVRLRISSSSKRSTFGTDRSGFGLDLAIAKQAADAHGGAIRAQNLPGKGSIFILELPSASSSALSLGTLEVARESEHRTTRDDEATEE